MDTTHKTILPNQKGQMSVFLAVVTILIISLMAFVINVGIFVKSKINLQNAVDAAAFSGAAAQSRYLNNIAYMNWEMRNIYKEWMFKYYVLGQMSLESTRNPALNNDLPGHMTFREPPLCNGCTSISLQADEYKQWGKYNIPSVCIDFTGTFNICDTATLPGLPIFQNQGLGGTETLTQNFLQELAASKGEDCSQRSAINFRVATHWAYGVDQAFSQLAVGQQIPSIGTDRPGAFPKAIEAAIRIRNLERIINEPPKQGMTRNPNNSLCQLEGNCFDINELTANAADAQAPIHERSVKAFWAGYRNLAQSPDGIQDLKETFVLSEFTPAPRRITATTDTSLSTYLIGQRDGTSPSTFQRSEKHYIDLRIQLLNFATFFNLFAAGVANINGTLNDASCKGRKFAIPVPGYPMGFIKNPEVLTYYAVRGEALFKGLLNPFQEPIKMIAYAAAKPYGGRIGPTVFKNTDDRLIETRSRFSLPYLTGLDLTAINANPPAAQDDDRPIPNNETFWVGETTNDIVGGIPDNSSGQVVKFAIPNLAYDFSTATPSGFSSNNPSAPYEVVLPAPSPSFSGNVRNRGGLYSVDQFFKFKYPPLTNLKNASIGSQLINEAIAHSQRPTAYEAANYLIPTMDFHNDSQNLASMGIIGSDQRDQPTSSPQAPKTYRIYAPLTGDGLLYNSPQDLNQTLTDFFDRNQSAVNVYLQAIQRAALIIRQQGIANANDNLAGAAYILHQIGDKNKYDNNAIASITDPDNINFGSFPFDDKDCKTISGKFNHLYYGPSGQTENAQECLPELKSALIQKWDTDLTGPNAEVFRNFYTGRYVRPVDVSETGGPIDANTLGIGKYMSAYLPGPRHGASQTGQNNSPLLGPDENVLTHRRNFYSTKLIPLQTVKDGFPFVFGDAGRDIVIFGEGIRNDSNLQTSAPNSFINPISDDLGGEIDTVLQ